MREWEIRRMKIQELKSLARSRKKMMKKNEMSKEEWWRKEVNKKDKLSQDSTIKTLLVASFSTCNVSRSVLLHSVRMMGENAQCHLRMDLWKQVPRTCWERSDKFGENARTWVWCSRHAVKWYKWARRAAWRRDGWGLYSENNNR